MPEFDQQMNTQQFQEWLQTRAHKSAQVNQARPLLMGILNITTDSFFDGGKFIAPERALSHARELINQGADIIDIGGESSRPGALPISVDEELNRVIPIIEAVVAESDICLSIDSCKTAVMEAALSAGAFMVNDISGLASDGAMHLLACVQRPVCLMHMQGIPTTMQENPSYQRHVIDEINHFFSERINACLLMGIKRENLILDPGFGFGKTIEHNLTIVKNLRQFAVHQLPLLLGVSRKSTIGKLLNKPVSERLFGSIALTVVAALQNAAIIRTHDVDETLQALQMIEAMNAI